MIVPPEPGTVLGPYELLSVLGSGGMGRVFEAREQSTGEVVALKVLLDSSLAASARFEREARIISRLAHPNIVGVRGHGRAPDGTLWLAMERLRGTDLGELLARGPLPVEESLRVAIEVCKALEHAHERAVVHRDLKPENIFLLEGEARSVKVLDFGIARAEDELRFTGTGMILGTLQFMSPEQARGASDIDARTDLWSLGALLYLCLSGRDPFEAETGPGILCSILLEAPPPLAQRVPGLPLSVAALVHRALSKPREERFPSAAAFRLTLQAALEELRSRRTSLGEEKTRLSLPPPNRPSMTAERRLTAVAYLRGVRDAAPVRSLAESYAGRVTELRDGDALAIFGMERWTGDEPLRAVRFALAALGGCSAASVTTGRVVRDLTGVAGDVVDAAVRLANPGPVRVDAATAGAVRDAVVLHPSADGTATVELARPSAPPMTVVGGPDTPFVGRELDVSLLLDAVQSAESNGSPTGVLVLSGPGMGKSRLAAEALAAARRPGVVVLQARCEVYRRDSPLAALDGALSEATSGALRLGVHKTRGSQADAEFGLDQLHGLLEVQLRGLASGATVLLVIDDAQWLDAASLAALQWAAEELTELPLCLWLFARPEARERLVKAIPGGASRELAPLPQPLARRVVEALAHGATDRIVEHAGGCPRFLEELARAYASRGSVALEQDKLPLSVQGAVLSQLDQLELPAREYLKRAAVFGRTAWHEAVLALGGEEAPLASLRRSNLLVLRPQPRFAGAREVGFRGVLLRDVAYDLWTAEQKQQLHQLAAEWLAKQQGITPDELAAHLDLAGESSAAALYRVEAAEAAAAIGDSETALRHAERALAATQEPALRWRALVAQDSVLQLGKAVEAQDLVLAELSKLAASMGPLARAEAAWRRCYFARLRNRPSEAQRYGELVLEQGEALPESPWLAAAHIELAMLDADRGDLRSALRHARTAEELAGKGEDGRLRARARATVAYVTIELDEVPSALALFEGAAREYAGCGDRRREALALVNASFALVRLGRFEAAEEQLERVLALSRAVGNHRTFAVAASNRATLRRVRGDVAGAQEDLALAGAEAVKLSHARLAAAVAIERAYLHAREQSPLELQVEAAEAAVVQARASGTPALLASAQSLALRARSRSGEVAEELLGAVSELYQREGVTREAQLELLCALWESSGHAQTYAQLGRATLAALLQGLTEPDARAECEAGACARFLLPEAFRSERPARAG